MPHLSTTPPLHLDTKTVYNSTKKLISPRETEVLLLIAYEYTNQEIADRLFLSKGTIASYRNNLLFKLEAKNTAGIIRISFEKNILALNKNRKTEICNNKPNHHLRSVTHDKNNVVH